MVTPDSGMRLAVGAMLISAVLAAVKIVTGLVGNSYALIADGIESLADIVSSVVVWTGLRISALPPDETHPYGHGKAESLAALVVCLALLGAASIIGIQSFHEIVKPHHAPAWYTLPVLVGVIIVKTLLSRAMHRRGADLNSTALKSDAWHHMSDALTSAAAFVGISLALIGGPGWEPADDWAALFACAVIAYNGISLLRVALDEIMDAAVPDETVQRLRQVARSTDGVAGIEKMRVRKSGLGLLMDIHVEVAGSMSVRDGHEIGHRVKDRLMESGMGVTDVTVHMEPARDDNGVPTESGV